MTRRTFLAGSVSAALSHGASGGPGFRLTDVTAAATDTGQKANLVLESSDRLGRKLQSLQAEVSRFLAGVRAA